MELKQYLIPLRKWWWLLIATTLVSTLSAFAATRFEEPIYRTSTTLIIGQTLENPNPSSGDFYLGTTLAQSYADIAQRSPVKDATMAALGLTWLPTYRVNVPPNNQLIEITVTDSSPARAQAVANMLAEQIIRQTPTGSPGADEQRALFINQQMDSLQAKIDETEAQITGLQNALEDMVSARQIADAQTQIASLEARLNTLQTNFATLLNNTPKGASNTLRVIEPAALPTTSISPPGWQTVLLGSVIGFVLAAAAAYLMEYLDNTIKTPDEAVRKLNTPVLGFIAELNTAAKGQDLEPYVAAHPRSPVAEAYRILRTNLEFTGVDQPLKTILITSPGPGEGKSTTAANLAVALAQGHKQVILLDCDLRRPKIHRFFGLSNQTGLSDIFRGQASVSELLLPTKIAGLSVMTSGSAPPNPAELLSSNKMQQILQELSELADVVIIDSPPFVVSDAIILGSKVDGVLMLVQPERTPEPAATAMATQLRRTGANLVGMVFNRITSGAAGYYGAYHYYQSPYYYDNGRQEYYLDESSPKSNAPAPKGTLARLRYLFHKPT
ncbi:MAG: polysaccharide biosynthesis tyrosine autokinase [Anaerolinea sp.]|nr:polysaccharide biosynthesis tyrosine autokinase [Anaerolinea sp.]